ncbi:DNA polymerase IV [Pseudobacteroides cellulosolvens]|uniref:DNA polymerase IV n=1 Tax=Pseudobacteroides cellulosolvens ATCC 35603 = DSM 2933 TaxID=398512 RepID=A0A0L6JR22_9FIRM|nr:DNA polymerase IV [Pseudobacteroides cellulosolvens]KNY28286.1 DNA polymerase IV [Pseudobacteroides cellulosolvens ATCC 35603 = DSM 2933]
MQKVVFLVDMNAFFISCEMIRNPSLAGKPSAVAGDPKKRAGIILAANYEARAYGVKTAMVIKDALRLCPNLVLVPPDHNYYESKSKQVMDLLSGYTPMVEQNSIDEAYLDMTGTEMLFGKPFEAANQIMNEIKNTLGLWCSIGIAENKFLAKMASEMKKPLGITELWQQDVPHKLWPLSIKSMYGIGVKTAEKLYMLGIQTIGQLAKYDKSILVKKFGKYGNELHDRANGQDTSPVQPHTEGDMKSIGRSTTLPEDITDIEKAKTILMELAEDIGMTARRFGKCGNTVQITIKYSDFESITRQTNVHKTCVTKDIYLAGCNLLEHNWNKFHPVRLLGISLSGFEKDCTEGQLSIFDVVEDIKKDDKHTKHENIDRTLDAIRNRHGFAKIGRAALINSKKKRDL